MDSIAIDSDSAVPPYEQLRAQIAGLVARGRLAPGTRLGTVRQTATDLGLAVNTVAKAYRRLEADGVVVTRGRKGTFVRSAVLDGPPASAAVSDSGSGTDTEADAGAHDRSDAAADPGQQARAAAARYVATARRLGLTSTEATRLVEERWAGPG